MMSSRLHTERIELFAFHLHSHTHWRRRGSQTHSNKSNSKSFRLSRNEEKRFCRFWCASSIAVVDLTMVKRLTWKYIVDGRDFDATNGVWREVVTDEQIKEREPFRMWTKRKIGRFWTIFFAFLLHNRTNCHLDSFIVNNGEYLCHFISVCIYITVTLQSIGSYMFVTFL